MKGYQRAFEMIIQAFKAGVLSEDDARVFIRDLNKEYGVRE